MSHFTSIDNAWGPNFAATPRNMQPRVAAPVMPAVHPRKKKPRRVRLARRRRQVMDPSWMCVIASVAYFILLILLVSLQVKVSRLSAMRII